MNSLLRGILWFGSGLIVLTACTNPDPDDSADSADFLFHSSRVYTVAGDAPWADAVTVTGDRISFVGSRAGAESLIGPGTRIIDLDGKMLMPGLIDSHTHIFVGSFSAQGVNLSLADTMDSLTEALQTLQEENPGDGVVYARGWQNHLFPPDGPRKEMLDAIFGDRPVALSSVDGHSTWFSSPSLASLRTRERSFVIQACSRAPGAASSGRGTCWRGWRSSPRCSSAPDMIAFRSTGASRRNPRWSRLTIAPSCRRRSAAPWQ